MKTRHKNIVRREPEILRRSKILVTFPHVWICIVITIAAVIMLFLSKALQESLAFWSSIFANIFAGLITGLVIYLVGGAKQIAIIKLQSQKEWLKELFEQIRLYMDDHDEMIKLHFEKYDGTQEIYDFYYDMSIHASNINVTVHQGTFNKTLLFDTDRYCLKKFDYNSVKMAERFDLLHEYVEMIDVNCPSSKEISQQFHTIHPELQKLRISVLGAMREIDIRLAELNRTII